MLGGLSAKHGDRIITSFRTEKTGLLLATLARESHGPLRRDELADRIWPDQTTEAGRNCLRVALSALRALLEPEPQDRGTVLQAGRHDVRLDSSRFTTDTGEFEANLLRAAGARDDVDKLSFLEAAVEQYQSDFLPQFDDVWSTLERERLSDAYQLALRGLVRLHVNQRRYDLALGASQRAVAADPYREESHRLLMRVYTLMGRPAAAHRQYKELERLLQQRLGTSPSRLTQEAFAQIGTFTDLSAKGGHGPGRTPISPREVSGASAKRPGGRLPAPMTRLIGREEAILQVLEMLDTPETRLVSLTGIGGVGKTRLAIAVAEQSRRHGTPVRYLSLVDLRDPDEIVTTLASALHVSLRPRGDLWPRLVDALSDEAGLLVLDNLEHLLPLAGVIVHRLLESVPALTCLTTSRQLLGVNGEYGYLVKPLSVPLAHKDAAEIAASPSVRLWLDRVRSLSPDKTVTQANCQHIAELCTALEGLPLAVELAAAWAGVLNPEQITVRLNCRFDMLVSRGPRIDARHASLRSALDWSYNLLEPRAQQFFARLGRFRSGWTLEAAEMVCAEPQALDLMAQLIERSLATVEETNTGTRYRYLESVREYAASLMCGETATETDRRFCDYYLKFVEASAPMLSGPRAADSLELTTAELDNLRSVVELGAADQPYKDWMLRLSAAMYRYWYIRGAPQEGQQWIRSALTFSPIDAPERPKALTALGNLSYAEGDFDAAEQCYEQCKTLSIASSDTKGVAGALGNLANVMQRRDDPRHALALAQQSLALYESLGDERGQALANGSLALISTDIDDNRSALEYGRQAISQFRSMGDGSNLMTALVNVGRSSIRLGRRAEAAAFLLESLELCCKLGARRFLVLILTCTASLARFAGEAELSVRLLACADAAAERLQITTVVQRPGDQDDAFRELREILGDEVVERARRAGTLISEGDAADLARDLCTRLS